MGFREKAQHHSQIQKGEARRHPHRQGDVDAGQATSQERTGNEPEAEGHPDQAERAGSPVWWTDIRQHGACCGGGSSTDAIDDPCCKQQQQGDRRPFRPGQADGECEQSQADD